MWRQASSLPVKAASCRRFRFRDPLNKERRFIPLRLDDAPIKGSLAQFLYINWLPAYHEQEYAKLLAACRPEANTRVSVALGSEPERFGAIIARLITQKDPVPSRNETLQIDALELCAKLKTVPPLREEEFKKDYRGFWVCWPATLTSASKHRSDADLCQLQLLPDVPEGYTTPIECSVRLADYPIMKVLQRGARLRVKGQIDDFSLFSVRLANATIEFPESQIAGKALERERQQQESERDDNLESRWTSCADFFYHRFGKAFPGIRDEVVWFSDANTIATRLDRLLHEPLRVGNFSPIWWFRGLSSNSVERFRRLDEKTWLFNYDELQIGRIAAVENRAYWQNFVYVEVNGVTPSGAYDRPDESFERMLKMRGYCSEEVCLFRGRYLKRTFFDDGAAEIDGQLVDLGDEAELRKRYLSKYNFVLTGQDSAINNTDFETQLHSLMNEILIQPARFEQLVQAVERLPKQVSYFNGRGPYVE